MRETKSDGCRTHIPVCYVQRVVISFRGEGLDIVLDRSMNRSNRTNGVRAKQMVGAMREGGLLDSDRVI